MTSNPVGLVAGGDGAGNQVIHLLPNDCLGFGEGYDVLGDSSTLIRTRVFQACKTGLSPVSPTNYGSLDYVA